MSKCPSCDTEVNVKGDGAGNTYYEPVDYRLVDIVKKYKIPFYCDVCWAIKLPIQAHNNYVIVWEPTPEKIGAIFIPDKVRKIFLKGIGVILSSGKGVSDKRKFIPNQTKPGDVVYYDKSVPWFVELYGVDGKLYQVPIMPEQDIKCIVDEEITDAGQESTPRVDGTSNQEAVENS